MFYLWQVSVPVPVCRSLCEKVRSDCGRLLWPPALQCHLLPLPTTGLCMQHPDIVTDTSLLQLLETDNRTLSSNLWIPPDQVTLLVSAVVSSAGLLLCLLALVCLLRLEDRQQLAMLVLSLTVLVSGLLLATGAGGEGTVCNLVSISTRTGLLSSLAWWWSITVSSLNTASCRPSPQLQQTIIWGSVILSSLAAFSLRGVETEAVTSVCRMSEQFISLFIPAAVFLVTGLLCLLAGLFNSKQFRCKQTTFLSYLYFFIFLGVFLTDFWAWTHSPSPLLSYSNLSLQFLLVSLCPLLVITSHLLSFLRSKDQTFSDGELSNLQNGENGPSRGSNLYQDSRHNIVSNKTLNTNISA